MLRSRSPVWSAFGGTGFVESKPVASMGWSAPSVEMPVEIEVEPDPSWKPGKLKGLPQD